MSSPSKTLFRTKHRNSLDGFNWTYSFNTKSNLASSRVKPASSLESLPPEAYARLGSRSCEMKSLDFSSR